MNAYPPISKNPTLAELTAMIDSAQAQADALVAKLDAMEAKLETKPDA